MGIEVSVEGGERLRSFATQMRAASQAGLGKEMAAGLRRATKPISASIRDEWERVGPGSGGYRELVSRSLRFRNTIKNNSRTASVTLVTFADGTKQRRDIQALERGVIRHPVFGRSRPGRRGERLANPWSVTTIAPGFHKRGTDAAIDRAEREMGAVLDDFAARLTGK